MVSLRVPATTANLGPGFDCLGCALNLYAHFTFEQTSGGPHITGCPPEYRNTNNLVYNAFVAACTTWGVAVPGLSIHINSSIPLSRGLGSSAALIVAGVAAASRLHGLQKNKQDILEIATMIEGHPDNVAPAIFGGLRVSLLEGEKVYTASAPIANSIRFLALVPDFNLSTQESRAVLPDTISWQDGVYNVGHAALLLRALETGDRFLLSNAMSDRLHQPYRFPLISGSKEIARIAREQGADGFCLSGAGPTLLCLYHKNDFPQRMAQALQNVSGNWQLMELEVDRNGLTLLF
ncbi:MAG: homoserine kinase [Christensenellales bacterium]|jgi:homoserine kinase